MKIYGEISLKDFDFWSGAADRAANLTDDDFDVIESNLEELHPDGMSDTELNDFFWFEFDTIAEWLGYKDEEDMDCRRNPFYLDDDDLEDYIEDYWKEYLDGVYENQGEDALKFIVTDLFGEDADEILEEYTDEAVVKTPAGVYYHFLNTHYDSSELMETLFEEDQAYEVLNDFPFTKEEFRDEMIKKHSKTDK